MGEWARKNISQTGGETECTWKAEVGAGVSGKRNEEGKGDEVEMGGLISEEKGG